MQGVVFSRLVLARRCMLMGMILSIWFYSKERENATMVYERQWTF